MRPAAAIAATPVMVPPAMAPALDFFTGLGVGVEFPVDWVAVGRMVETPEGPIKAPGPTSGVSGRTCVRQPTE